MTKLNSFLRYFASSLVLASAAMSAMAADLGGSKDAPAASATRERIFTVNGGLTSDYVFRGQSQSEEGPAVFAGVDLAYGVLYAGFWGSSVADGVSKSGLEIDVYGGIKKSYHGVDFDFGAIYYAYPNDGYAAKIDYMELKAAASGKIWRDIALTGTLFWSPDYTGEAGSTWTVEGKVAAPLPIAGLTLSGALGHVTSEDEDAVFSGAFGDDNYTYWNIGLARTVLDRFTVDVRYWGTDADPTGAAAEKIVDDRFAATLTFNY